MVGRLICIGMLVLLPGLVSAQITQPPQDTQVTILDFLRGNITQGQFNQDDGRLLDFGRGSVTDIQRTGPNSFRSLDFNSGRIQEFQFQQPRQFHPSPQPKSPRHFSRPFVPGRGSR